MNRCFGILCASLLFCSMFSDTIQLAKEKRGWTLNSAGYLLGPHGVNGHKPGLAGKRDMDQEEDFRTVDAALRCYARHSWTLVSSGLIPKGTQMKTFSTLLLTSCHTSNLKK
ncbi:galanin peptides isoform X1 [Nerophis ophidion]|uniref:galanin peptides isoform X1 n=1 Tax=Nerophis ophidion TaxID=159077 RepID=UPI002AE00294|nr:galanin peptides isoform X1 [Nerophis ophidion]XP_061769109.1 galanin peptides isoform X1 [Nerophis ophidion]